MQPSCAAAQLRCPAFPAAPPPCSAPAAPACLKASVGTASCGAQGCEAGAVLLDIQLPDGTHRPRTHACAAVAPGLPIQRPATCSGSLCALMQRLAGSMPPRAAGTPLAAAPTQRCCRRFHRCLPAAATTLEVVPLSNGSPVVTAAITVPLASSPLVKSMTQVGVPGTATGMRMARVAAAHKPAARSRAAGGAGAARHCRQRQRHGCCNKAGPSVLPSRCCAGREAFFLSFLSFAGREAAGAAAARPQPSPRPPHLVRHPNFACGKGAGLQRHRRPAVSPTVCTMAP